MNKEYFVKFLPVNGNIKEGDKAIDYEVDFNNIMTFVKDNEWINDKFERVILTQWRTRFHFKKVELFLCSRNIKVDDTFISKNGETHQCKAITEANETLYFPKATLVWTWLESNGNIKYWRPISECYKTIGKISSQAIWIKENDEFDNTEVKLNHICYDSPCNDGYCFHCCRSKGCDSTDYQYLIKGSCGHFH